MAIGAFALLQPEPPVTEEATGPPSAALSDRETGPPAAAPADPERRRQPVAEPTDVGPPAEKPAGPAVEVVPTLGTLRIQTDVPGAQVFLDRQFVGAAPVLAENITPGSHQLNVSAEGFESYAATLDVTAGERDVVIRFREVRLDSAVDVIHRHGIGSCRGRLIATPQGIRYETANRDDAFTTPLVDLETFQVDYLAKNLRVKLPKGRQFNFTDPEGNADRLFVFHRDVDKARERLRKGDPPATN